MDGNFRINEAQHQRQVIEAWMLSNIQSGGFKIYDDLHIDRIDERWRDRKNWIDGGLYALGLAIELRDKHQLEFTVAMGCSLLVPESGRPISVPRNKEELTAQIDWAPPSLYLFPRHQEPWLEWGEIRTLEDLSNQTLRDSQLGPKPQPYYLEFTQEGRKHRSIFFAL